MPFPSTKIKRLLITIFTVVKPRHHANGMPRLRGDSHLSGGEKGCEGD
jgi:hypothetical protein